MKVVQGNLLGVICGERVGRSKNLTARCAGLSFVPWRQSLWGCSTVVFLPQSSDVCLGYRNGSTLHWSVWSFGITGNPGRRGNVDAPWSFGIGAVVLNALFEGVELGLISRHCWILGRWPRGRCGACR